MNSKFHQNTLLEMTNNTLNQTQNLIEKKPPFLVAERGNNYSIEILS